MYKKCLFYTVLFLTVVSFFFLTVPVEARNGSSAPPWFTNPDNAQGGPSWLGNPQEGVGPWFWQAYNGFDVTGIAPIWYTDPVNAPCAPSWYLSGSGGPWWSSYIMETDE